MDASKQWGFAAIVYHVRGDPPDGVAYPRTAVQPIMFLSKCLNNAEKNYWPTELEVAGIVWVIRKIRHLVESTEVPPVVVFTDHSAAVPISRQTTLTTSSTDKLNLRLVRASQYLSGFNLSVRHKPGKANVVPDALSRLQAEMYTSSVEKLGVLESLYGHPVELLERTHAIEAPIILSQHISLVGLSDEFKQRLTRAYLDDEHWTKILAMVKPNETDHNPGDNAVREAASGTTGAHPNAMEAPRGIRFGHQEGLLYYMGGNGDGHERLCIPESMEAEVFKQAHD